MTTTPLDELDRGSASATRGVVLPGTGGIPELNVPFLDDLELNGSL